MGLSLCGRTAVVGSMRWEPSRRTTRPPVSADQGQQTSQTPLMWQSSLDNTLAADVACRCLVKIKDSAMNAINKPWVGARRNGLRGNSKGTSLWLDTERRRACPCGVWLSSDLNTAVFILHSVMVYQVQSKPPPTECRCSCYIQDDTCYIYIFYVISKTVFFSFFKWYVISLGRHFFSAFECQYSLVFQPSE